MHIDKLEENWELQQDINMDAAMGDDHEEIEDNQKQIELDDCAHYLVQICGLVLEEETACISILSAAWTPDQTLFDKDTSEIYYLSYCVWLNTDHRWEFQNRFKNVSNCVYHSLANGLLTTSTLIKQGLA